MRRICDRMRPHAKYKYKYKYKVNCRTKCKHKNKHQKQIHLQGQQGNARATVDFPRLALCGCAGVRNPRQMRPAREGQAPPLRRCWRLFVGAIHESPGCRGKGSHSGPPSRRPLRSGALCPGGCREASPDASVFRAEGVQNGGVRGRLPTVGAVVDRGRPQAAPTGNAE